MRDMFYGHAPMVNGLFLMNLERNITHVHSVDAKRCKVDNDSPTYFRLQVLVWGAVRKARATAKAPPRATAMRRTQMVKSPMTSRRSSSPKTTTRTPTKRRQHLHHQLSTDNTIICSWTLAERIPGGALPTRPFCPPCTRCKPWEKRDKKGIIEHFPFFQEMDDI